MIGLWCLGGGGVIPIHLYDTDIVGSGNFADSEDSDQTGEFVVIVIDWLTVFYHKLFALNLRCWKRIIITSDRVYGVWGVIPIHLFGTDIVGSGDVADGEDSAQTGRMPRLIRVLAGLMGHLLSLSFAGLLIFITKCMQQTYDAGRE